MSGVKSAMRTLAVLEYLRQCRPSTLGEIARSLEMPVSSTAALLKTLASAGYLTFSPENKRYRPSYRVALLGESVDESPSLGDGALQRCLHDLHDAMGETLIAGLQNGAYVQYIHVIAENTRLLQRLPVGKLRLMGYNPMGRVLLAQLDTQRATSILRHNNANWNDEKTRQSEATLLASVAQSRQDGFSIGPGLTWPNATLVATTVRLRSDMPAMAIAIGGLNVTVLPKLDAIQATMRTMLAPWLIERR